MSIDDLEKAVFILDYEGKTLTPEDVKDAWSRSCHSRISWPPEDILANTLPESDEHPLRSLITPENILDRYGLLIDSIVQRDSFEGPFPPRAHLLVSYVKDDSLLNITPQYIHDRFQAALRNGVSASGSEGALREAVYLFQSTELSPSHRAAFTPDDIGNLFQLCLDNLNEDTTQSLVEIYNTTQDTPAYRDAITPEMAKDAFQFCLDRATKPRKRSNPGFYVQQALLMLRYTIADDRLRSPQGISYRQIEALTRYYESVISKEQERITSGKPSFSVHLSRPEINIAFARNALQYIDVCTLPSSDSDQVARLTSHFKEKVGRPRTGDYIASLHARECLAALARYSSAEPA